MSAFSLITGVISISFFIEIKTKTKTKTLVIHSI